MTAPSLPPKPALLRLGILIGILAASTAAIFIRFAQDSGISSLAIAAGRLTIASLVLAPLAISKYRADMAAMRTRDWSLALLSGFFLALHFASWITSLEFTTVASSVVLVSTTPIWIALLAPAILHERIGKLAVIGLILTLGGGLFISLSDVCTFQSGLLTCPPLGSFFAGSALAGDLLALMGAFMGAGYFIVGRKLRSRLSLIPYIFIVYSTAALVLLALMIVLGKTPTTLPADVLLWIVLLALVPQLLGHSLFNWALKHLPASFLSITLLGEPVGSIILAFLIFQEFPTGLQMIGALLLLAGIWLASRNNAAG